MKITDAIKKAIDAGNETNKDIADFIKEECDLVIDEIAVKKVRNRYLKDYVKKEVANHPSRPLPPNVRQATPAEGVSLSAKTAALLAKEIYSLKDEVSLDHVNKILYLAASYGITEVQEMVASLLELPKT